MIGFLIGRGSVSAVIEGPGDGGGGGYYYFAPTTDPTLGDNVTNSPDAFYSSGPVYNQHWYGLVRTGMSYFMYGQFPPNVVVNRWFVGNPYSRGTNYIYDFVTWPLQNFPSPSATIKEVYVVARCISNYAITVELGYYTNYSAQQASPVGLNNSYGLYGPYFRNAIGDQSNIFQVVQWRVTNLEHWTPELMNSTQLAACLIFDRSTEEGYGIIVDYIGFEFNWTDPGNTWTPPADYEMGGMSYANMTYAAMGVAGFVGMIGAPALGIFLARTSDEKPMLFLKMFVLTAICFAFFIAGIS